MIGSLTQIPIENINVNLIMVIGAVVFIAGLAFSMGMLYSKINEVSITATNIFKEVLKQDDRIDNIEKDHVTREEFQSVRDMVITIASQHNANHKE